MKKSCMDLVDFFAGEMTREERRYLEIHLTKCLSCQNDFGQLAEAWRSLQFDFVPREVPDSLKNEVLNFVFQQDAKNSS